MNIASVIQEYGRKGMWRENDVPNTVIHNRICQTLAQKDILRTCRTRVPQATFRSLGMPRPNDRHIYEPENVFWQEVGSVQSPSNCTKTKLLTTTLSLTWR